MNSGSYRSAYQPLRTAPEGSFSSFAVDGSLTSSRSYKSDGPTTSLFDPPEMDLYNGFGLYVSHFGAGVEVFGFLLDSDDLRFDGLGSDLGLPPTSFFGRPISAKRCDVSQPGSWPH